MHSAPIRMKIRHCFIILLKSRKVNTLTLWRTTIIPQHRWKIQVRVQALRKDECIFYRVSERTSVGDSLNNEKFNRRKISFECGFFVGAPNRNNRGDQN